MVLFKASDYTSELDLIIKNKFEKLETDKKLAIISIGKGNEKFIEIKKKIADSYGIDLEIFLFKNSAKKKEVFETLSKLNESEDYGGIVVQYPFPAKYTYSEIAEKISPAKDIDFLNPVTYGHFALETKEDFMPPTVRALDFLLKTYKLELRGQKYVVFGQGVLIGRPMANYLLNREVTLVSVNEFTKQKKKVVEDADFVITGTGSPKSITGDMLKRGACVVDFGTGDIENPGMGDFDKDSELSHLNIVATSPGGLGPLMVRYLFLNFLEFIEKSDS